jgi:magnesium transporter
MFADTHKRMKKIGQPPGTPIYTGEKSKHIPVITVITYNDTEVSECTGNSLEECLTEQKSDRITWIDVEGLHDTALITQIAKLYNLHPLTIEDILNVEHRPKVEEFEDYIYIILKVLLWNVKTSSFTISPLSLIIGKNYILSFQEYDTTRFDNLYKRIKSTSNQRLRQQGSDYLAYRIIDSVIDDYFVVLEAVGDKLEKDERRIIIAPKAHNAQNIYHLKRQLILLRKAIWPMREMISHLLYVEDKFITKFTRVYLRDVYDHTVQAIDTLETFRDMLSSMLDMYLSGLTVRMNEIMKTLTIITTIFIPITALASIYGMNLIDVPLMKSDWGFDIVFSLMIIMAVFMIVYFKKKKWF